MVLNIDIDLDPLATFAAAMGLRANGGRTWRDGDKQVFLDEDVLRLQIDLGHPRLSVRRRPSPHLTGSPLDLLLDVVGDDADLRGRLEEHSERLLCLLHAQGAVISEGVLRWRISLGDVHSFAPELPDVAKTQDMLTELKLLARGLS